MRPTGDMVYDWNENPPYIDPSIEYFHREVPLISRCLDGIGYVRIGWKYWVYSFLGRVFVMIAVYVVYTGLCE
jgi:hypothetical protein